MRKRDGGRRKDITYWLVRVNSRKPPPPGPSRRRSCSEAAWRCEAEEEQGRMEAVRRREAEESRGRTETARRHETEESRSRGGRSGRRARPEEGRSRRAAWPPGRFLGGRCRGGRRPAGPMPRRAELRRRDPPSSRPGVRARLTRSAEVEAGELERRHQDPPSSRPQSSSAAAEIRRVPQRRRAGRRKEGRISAEEEGPPLEEGPGRRCRRPGVR